MKKIICVLLAVMMMVFCFGCKKEEAVSAEPTENPVVDIKEKVEATPEPEEKPVDLETVMSTLVCSDADVDSIMNQDVSAWDGYSVVTVENGQGKVFYIIPEAKSTKIENAVACIKMDSGEQGVTSVVCTIFADMTDKNEEACEKVFEFIRDSFPLDAFGNLQEASWEEVKEKIPMDYDAALEAIKNASYSEQSIGYYKYGVTHDDETEETGIVFNFKLK